MARINLEDPAFMEGMGRAKVLRQVTHLSIKSVDEILVLN
jgi:hypothetical protein